MGPPRFESFTAVGPQSIVPTSDHLPVLCLFKLSHVEDLGFKEQEMTEQNQI